MRILLALSVRGAPVSNSPIECLEFRDSARAERRPERSGARRVHDPIALTKPVDGASPSLARALSCGERLDGEIRFVRGHEGELVFTIAFADGRIASIARQGNAGESGVGALTETICLVFNHVKWIHPPSGAEFKDAWE